MRVKSDTRRGEPAGSAFRVGSTTTRTAATARKAQRSRVRIASLGREKPGRSTLDEQDHEDEDADLAEDGAQARLDDLVEAADPHGGQDGAEQLAHAARDHDHERIHDVVL